MNDAALPHTTANMRNGAGAEPSARMGGRRRRLTLREADRLTDALRVTRAVLRRVAAHGGDERDSEAVDAAIDTANTALGGTT